jgi:hypothetical protein
MMQMQSDAHCHWPGRLLTPYLVLITVCSAPSPVQAQFFQPSEEEFTQLIRDHAMKCKWKLEGNEYSNGSFALMGEQAELSVMGVKWSDTEVEFMLMLSPPLNLDDPLKTFQQGSRKGWAYSGKWKYKRDIVHFRWVIDEKEPCVILGYRREAVNQPGRGQASMSASTIR